ncbi:PREDICTED: broad-complex core protein isoforms 1/2/3/4/5 isoform X1 [Acromyrmex echinatior]|uniref:broad-complex core protein isoforms 1/2/3/4/5 isoform X1 n=1 Tax=Acromyrmex echinatior TaxID=103372 RepID=UPI0005810A89|nr:PREDICTED: broad-complex core protein isoforms 1/2/3/4/5 isoform X1 [Acromyrmex echinatior]XP_011066805.1 PREDICTED: broad-complex core protein isoforms 1/2/3/4/5 isoform X1 [Acromyrmex echinatior]XP_011066806.1 PREDICTED: broad-complex core protein isoforms 1/2/3/4/5 isoform X1 [Acromyrmex echinatior]XP_011066808.1 PREDICTED: broad-complex core protein isoforms 1/2/3/4/5 isoform X1 [Acromyrmex echinatior]XP_011066809.1 PREDICTED: broad-complex core protein isoforms 1/2/3/4/5 isoform X1 [Acr
MVDTQHFCLRWNNYQSSITSAFENLRDDEDFVDVTLACDGKSLKAHRVVLSACSPYFRELLKSTPCKHPVIVLQDVAFSDLHALVEFIYHGEVNVHQRSLSSFLKTAEVLRVSGLTQQTDQTDRDELSHVRALAAGGNHLPFHEKSEETFPRGGSPTPVTPTPTTVQQLLRRAQIRRNERRTPDPHDESAKRPRVPSPPLNNNDATPTDFSMVKNNHLSTKVEGNGVHDENSLVEENIKCEPLELTGGNGGGNAGNEDSSDSGAAASDRPPASASSNEHEPEPEHTSAQNFLPESKLFTSTPGSFNFSMAALTTDHTPLSVKFPGLGHGLQTPDLAGTSQDQEVTEEDGGWQSATNIEYQRKVQESNQNTSANRYSETMVQSQPQELPIIDLLDNINDQMEIVLKSEPISPRMVDLESCLLSNHTLESHTDLDSTHEYRQDDLRDKQQPQTSGRFSNNDAPSRFNLPRLRSQNGIVQSLRAYYESDRKSTNRTYCNFCQKTFSRAWSLQRHLADTHFYVPQSLSCDQCGRSYKSRNSLVSHKSQYHARKDRKEQEAKCEVTY